VLTAGKIWTREDAEAVLAKGADVIALARAGILNPSWPRDTAAGHPIKQPPITEAELIERAVSPPFATYLRRWKNFVAG
jgi:2,4-dienoyl-CoA reductase-like NADH-dependent reductase (Old Yellow Enzyme family)